MAAQVYVELYDEEAVATTWKCRPTQRYVVYDRAYQAEDNWLATVGSILRGQFGTVKNSRKKRPLYEMLLLKRHEPPSKSRKLSLFPRTTS